MTLYIGLMSGTSMDGVDVALVDVQNHRLIAGLTHPYSPKAEQYLKNALSSPHVTIAALSQLNIILGREFAEATLQLLQRVDIPRQEIKAIGSHGQTIAHDANASIPYTLQLACPHTIAHLTGIPVVADFRTRDLVLGGKGAPFAPIYHQALLGTSAQAIVNIGGIANVSYLADEGTVRGYDIGPGNCLLDAWIQQHLNLSYDNNGTWAASGQVCENLLTVLLRDDYFQQLPPKSIGKEYFNLDWLIKQPAAAGQKPEDIQATLLALTTKAIAMAIQHDVSALQQVFICGGGVHNRQMMQSLAQQLSPIEVVNTQLLGIDPDYIEAMMFAWLADKCLNHIALDLTKITGSSKPAVLGIIYPAV